MEETMKKATLFLLVLLMISLPVNALGVFSYRQSEKPLVLMYHKLSENAAEWSDFCTSPQNFESDIIFLKKAGYVFKTAAELVQKPTPKTQKVAVITFDDGYDSDYKYALPILEKHSVKATFFVVGSFVGTPGYLSEETLKKLSVSPFVEIGNHSYQLHKKNYAEITELQNGDNYREAVDDFERNTRYLETAIGKKVTSLSYPNGIYSEKVNAQIMSKDIAITFSTGGERFIYKGKTPVGRKNRGHDIQIEDLF